MATQRLSPTGNLLRNSRLFSLPPPLPRPSGTLTASQRFDSETATLPYPTQAAIETTPSSLGKGDWGLKRSLPLKSTARTSTPIIRIGDVDSINHITDFDSAADHALNLKKWQEMGLPVSKAESPRRSTSKTTGQDRLKPHKSVFESSEDNTQARDDIEASGRWKYGGPWLAGQTQGQFNKYAEEEIRKRKVAFRDFLRKRLSERMASARRRAALDSGEATSNQPASISDIDLETYIKALRKDESTLFHMIEEFLDLPNAQQKTDVWTSTESVEGPPITHPSAGLSYLRAIAHTSNHPVLGPQREERPLRGRILATRTYQRAQALVGVGGIVAEDSRQDGLSNESDGVRTFSAEAHGGTKVWVKPEQITINSQGKIRLHVKRADQRLVGLYEEQPEQPPAERNPVVLPSMQEYVPDLSPPPLKTASGRLGGYGLGGDSFRAKASGAKRGDDTSEIRSILDLDGGAT